MLEDSDIYFPAGILTGEFFRSSELPLDRINKDDIYLAKVIKRLSPVSSDLLLRK